MLHVFIVCLWDNHCPSRTGHRAHATQTQTGPSLLQPEAVDRFGLALETGNSSGQQCTGDKARARAPPSRRGEDAASTRDGKQVCTQSMPPPGRPPSPCPSTPPPFLSSPGCLCVSSVVGCSILASGLSVLCLALLCRCLPQSGGCRDLAFHLPLQRHTKHTLKKEKKVYICIPPPWLHAPSCCHMHTRIADWLPHRS
jgi:hypothetical protein